MGTRFIFVHWLNLPCRTYAKRFIGIFLLESLSNVPVGTTIKKASWPRKKVTFNWIPAWISIGNSCGIFVAEEKKREKNLSWLTCRTLCARFYSHTACHRNVRERGINSSVQMYPLRSFEHTHTHPHVTTNKQRKHAKRRRAFIVEPIFRFAREQRTLARGHSSSCPTLIESH